MATRAPETVSSSGLLATPYAASAGGDEVPADVILVVFNTTGSPVTLTLVTPGVVDGDLAVADRTSTIPAAVSGVPGHKFVRPTRVPYASPSTGRVSLSWSSATGVSFEVIQ